MVTFRNNQNNNRRSNFRRNERNYKSGGERQKFNSSFGTNENFKRKAPGRNNHNAAKLIDKYNDLAREASSNGDKILSENYLQHADHFTRILNERESLRKEKFVDDNEREAGNFSNQTSDTIVKASENKTLDLQDESEATKASKSQIEAN